MYALRKQTPEPVFGIIKSVMGYRQCLLRGLESVKGEWNLVTMCRISSDRTHPISCDGYHLIS
jgi:Transposase DDE domain